MKALTFQGKQHISYQTIADPQIVAPTDAIVKVHLSAVCGSDLHIYHERETGLDCGTAMGHEFTGEVVAKGKAVNLLQIGDKVMSPFTTNCGQCYYCTIGLTCRCIHGQLYGWVAGGQGLHGGQAEYVRVPLADSTLLKIPAHISDEEALLLGDIRSTGYYCADMANIQPEGTYVVVGCGPVGLMAIVGAKELGAQTIYALDAVPNRLEAAQNFGAIPLNYQSQDVQAILQDATDGRGADAVLEVVGSAAASRTAVDLLRPGGIIATVGVHTDPQFSFSPIEAYDKNLTYKIGRCPARHYMQQLIQQVSEMDHKADVTSIITHRFPLSKGAEAYRIFDKKLDNSIKIVLENAL